MTNEMKKEITAFLRDFKKMCKMTDCVKCPMINKACRLSPLFDVNSAIAAVEEWRKRKKPKPEVIDKALDIYTIEVQKVRKHPGFNVGEYISIRDVMEHFKMFGYTITGFKAQRFVLESHREDAE